MDAVLSVDRLTVDYGRVRAVTDVTLAVRRGAITTIIGSNGAGKTTILKAIVGLVPAQSASVRFDGQEIAGWSTDRIVKAGIGVVPEGRRLFASMSVRENLFLGAYARNDREGIDRSLEEVTGFFPVLGERMATRASSLSGGQQQMLAIGRALMNRPKLLILDEPSIGLAPVVVDRIAEILAIINNRGDSILVVEQNAGMALRLAQDAYVIQDGAVVLGGSAADLERNEVVRRAYLGI